MFKIKFKQKFDRKKLFLIPCFFVLFKCLFSSFISTSNITLQSISENCQTSSVFDYFEKSDFTSRFFPNDEYLPIPRTSMFSHKCYAIRIPKINANNSYEIYVYSGKWTLSIGGFGVAYKAFRYGKDKVNFNDAAVIKFENMIHKKKYPNLWRRKYANHSNNESYYLRKFALLLYESTETFKEFDSSKYIKTKISLTKYIDGEHIHDLVNRGIVTTMDTFFKIKLAILKEVQKFHFSGYCHMDLHGRNIKIVLSADQNEEIKVSLLDFGWTKRILNANDQCIEKDIERLYRTFKQIENCIDKNERQVFKSLRKPCRFFAFEDK